MNVAIFLMFYGDLVKKKHIVFVILLVSSAVVFAKFFYCDDDPQMVYPAPDIEHCPLPKVLAVHWQDYLNEDADQMEEWEKMVACAREEGFNGMLMVLHNDAPNRSVESVVSLCERYCHLCAQYGMELHLAFSALEGAQEISCMSFWDFLLSPLRGLQPFWQEAENARSVLVEGIIKSLNSPYFRSISFLHQPQYILSKTKDKYEKSIEALAHQTWAHNKDITVVVHGNFGDLMAIPFILPNNHDVRLVRAGHFYPSDIQGRWSADQVQQIIDRLPPGSFISMLHFDECMRENEADDEDQRADFLLHALDMAVRRHIHVGVFGLGRLKTHGEKQHSKHGMSDSCRKKIAAKIQELRSHNLLAWQHSIGKAC